MPSVSSLSDTFGFSKNVAGVDLVSAFLYQLDDVESSVGLYDARCLFGVSKVERYAGIFRHQLCASAESDFAAAHR